MYEHQHIGEVVLKKQSTVETSVFAAEFVTREQGKDALRGSRYKLRTMGIPISSLLYIYGDNMSVGHNKFRPESVLRKKSNSVCYQLVHESVAIGNSLIGNIPSKENIKDLIQKSTMGRRKCIWSAIFFMIFMMNIYHQF